MAAGLPRRTVFCVSAVHMAVILVLIFWAGWKGCAERHKPLIIPVEFTVAVAPEYAEEQITLQEPVAPVPKQINIPEEAVEPPPKPKPKPKPVKRAIERSTARVTRRDDSAAVKPAPALSEEEIKKLLLEGAKPADHTSDPGEDARMAAIIHRRLYAAWLQPSREDAGNAVAVVEIRLAGSGRIVGAEIIRSSGNAILDQSVRQAVQSVPRIDGLSNDFVLRNPVIKVSFKVE